MLTKLQRESDQPFWVLGEEDENAWFWMMGKHEVAESFHDMNVGEMRFLKDGTFIKRIQ